MFIKFQMQIKKMNKYVQIQYYIYYLAILFFVKKNYYITLKYKKVININPFLYLSKF